jgi:hypothetical protein
MSASVTQREMINLKTRIERYKRGQSDFRAYEYKASSHKQQASGWREEAENDPADPSATVIQSWLMENKNGSNDISKHGICEGRALRRIS